MPIREKYCYRFQHPKICQHLIFKEPKSKGSRCGADDKKARLVKDKVGLLKCLTCPKKAETRKLKTDLKEE